MRLFFSEVYYDSICGSLYWSDRLELLTLQAFIDSRNEISLHSLFITCFTKCNHDPSHNDEKPTFISPLIEYLVFWDTLRHAKGKQCLQKLKKQKKPQMIVENIPHAKCRPLKWSLDIFLESIVVHSKALRSPIHQPQKYADSISKVDNMALEKKTERIRRYKI